MIYETIYVLCIMYAIFKVNFFWVTVYLQLLTCMYIVHGLIQGSERGPAPQTTNEDIVDQSLDLFKV